MRPEPLSNEQPGDKHARSTWKSTLVAGIFLIGFLAGLLYINAFASPGVSIAIGIIVAVIALILGRRIRKQEPGKPPVPDP